MKAYTYSMYVLVTPFSTLTRVAQQLAVGCARLFGTIPLFYGTVFVLKASLHLRGKECTVVLCFLCSKIRLKIQSEAICAVVHSFVSV